MTATTLQAFLSDLGRCWVLVSLTRMAEDNELVVIKSTDTEKKYCTYVETGSDKLLKDALMVWIRDFCLLREKHYYLDTSDIDWDNKKPDAKRHRAKGLT